ncbi:MAG: RNA pseudouridine synthase [Treponema sp.]|nr:RNA pseudouridine synthase [Treponema sp.]
MAATNFLSIDNYTLPQILAVERDFLVVYKPPKMHSAPLPRSAETDSLAAWCAALFPETAAKFPETAALPERQAGEGGLLHRLDYETHGLLLVARTAAGMDYFLAQQEKGAVLKEYSALAAEGATPLPGFPPCEFLPRTVAPREFAPHGEIIQSAFRAYGPGRKAVRPVIASNKVASGAPAQYVTEVLQARPLARGVTAFRLRIVRGFRHQIRCHLAWIGLPILNDSLYGGALDSCPLESGALALRASRITFDDPVSGRQRTFAIRPLEAESFL